MSHRNLNPRPYHLTTPISHDPNPNHILEPTSTLISAQKGWIGFNDGESEGTWTWNRGSCGSTYSSWWDGEPNDYCGGEDCAHTSYVDYGN